MGHFFPSSPRSCGRDINKISRTILVRSGRGGDQIPETSFWCFITTPSARLRMLPRLFLIAQPPLLEEEGKGPSLIGAFPANVQVHSSIPRLTAHITTNLCGEYGSVF